MDVKKAVLLSFGGGGMLRYTYSNNNNIMIIILWLSESRKELQGGEGGYGDTDTTISWLAQT